MGLPVWCLMKNTLSSHIRQMAAWCAALLLLSGLVGCSPKIQLFGGTVQEPLQETVLEGKGADKIALIHLKGIIRLSPSSGLLSRSPGTVHAIAARLDKAAEDSSVKAVVLAIESPGGSVTASDILHHAIVQFKAETGKPVIAALMGMAASGGYYAAAACDRIIAHPTTTTGSIGTIFIRPDLSGLMDKVGVRAEVTKSGSLKDMASPFRNATHEERELLQTYIAEHNDRFLQAVQQGRGLTDAQLADVADARIMTASQAKNAGLVDALGYLDTAIEEARVRAGLDEASVVVYRRAEVADDSAYALESSPPRLPGIVAGELGAPHTLSATGHVALEALGPFGMLDALHSLAPGFYWIWMGGG